MRARPIGDSGRDAVLHWPHCKYLDLHSKWIRQQCASTEYELLKFALNFRRQDGKKAHTHTQDDSIFVTRHCKILGMSIVPIWYFCTAVHTIFKWIHNVFHSHWIHDNWKIHFKRIISIWFDWIQFMFVGMCAFSIEICKLKTNNTRIHSPLFALFFPSSSSPFGYNSIRDVGKYV